MTFVMQIYINNDNQCPAQTILYNVEYLLTEPKTMQVLWFIFVIGTVA